MFVSLSCTVLSLRKNKSVHIKFLSRELRFRKRPAKKSFKKGISCPVMKHTDAEDMVLTETQLGHQDEQWEQQPGLSLHGSVTETDSKLRVQRPGKTVSSQIRWHSASLISTPLLDASVKKLNTRSSRFRHKRQQTRKEISCFCAPPVRVESFLSAKFQLSVST